MSCLDEDDGKNDIKALGDLVYKKAALNGGRAKVKAAFAKYGAERFRDIRIRDFGALAVDLAAIVEEPPPPPAPAIAPEYVELSTIPFGAIVERYSNRVLYMVVSAGNGTGFRELVTLAGIAKAVGSADQDMLVKLVSLRVPEGAFNEPKFATGDKVLLYGNQYTVRGIDELTYRLSNGGSYLARKLTKVETAPSPPPPMPLLPVDPWKVGSALDDAKCRVVKAGGELGQSFRFDGVALINALDNKGMTVTYKVG